MAKPANCPANTGGPCKGQRAPAALLKPDGSDRRRAGGGRREKQGGHPPKKKKRPWDSGAPSLRWLISLARTCASTREGVLLRPTNSVFARLMSAARNDAQSATIKAVNTMKLRTTATPSSIFLIGQITKNSVELELIFISFD